MSINTLKQPASSSLLSHFPLFPFSPTVLTHIFSFPLLSSLSSLTLFVCASLCQPVCAFDTLLCPLIHLSVCVSLYNSVCLSVCVCPYVCLFVYLFVCLLACLSASLSISLSVTLSVCLFVCLFFTLCLSLRLSVCPSLSRSLSLALCLSIFNHWRNWSLPIIIFSHPLFSL